MTICPGHKTYFHILNLGDIPYVKESHSFPDLYLPAQDPRTMAETQWTLRFTVLQSVSLWGWQLAQTRHGPEGEPRSCSPPNVTAYRKNRMKCCLSWNKRHGTEMDLGFSEPFFLKEGLPSCTEDWTNTLVCHRSPPYQNTEGEVPRIECDSSNGEPGR